MVEGTTLEIKGKEYTVGDDELILDDDEKGDLKIDAEGRLLGGKSLQSCTLSQAANTDWSHSPLKAVKTLIESTP